MLSAEQRKHIQDFFVNANNKILYGNKKRKVFTCAPEIEGLFAVWYDNQKVNGCEVTFERKPSTNDYVIEIIVTAGDKLNLTTNITEKGATIKAEAPVLDKHDVAVAMSDILIDYIAKQV